MLLNGNAELATAENFYGTASLIFRAWDGTVGQNGDTNINIIEFGGETAFSERAVTVRQVVTAVNNPPQILGGNETQVTCSNTETVFLAPDAQVLDIDSDGTIEFSFVGGSLNVNWNDEASGSVNLNIDTSDNVFSISNQTLFLQGDELGNVSGRESNSLTISEFKETATIEAIRNLIHHIVIAPPSNSVCIGGTVSFSLNDGGNVDANNNSLTNESPAVVTVATP